MPTGISGLYKNTKGAKEAEKRNRERERLIELIGKELLNYASWHTEMALAGNYDMPSVEEVIADKLLANGVKVEIPNNSVSMVDGHIDVTDINVGGKKEGVGK